MHLEDLILLNKSAYLKDPFRVKAEGQHFFLSSKIEISRNRFNLLQNRLDNL